MAHAIFHFGCGLAAGAVLGLPAVLRRARPTTRASRIAALWLIASYALGTWAVVPSLLRACGMSRGIVSAPLMNVFLFHPLLDRVETGGMLEGEILVAGTFLIHYLTLVSLVALRMRPRARHQV